MPSIEEVYKAFLEKLRDSLYKLAELLSKGFFLAMNVGDFVDKEIKRIIESNTRPSTYQWANRLIEYIESDRIVEVFSRFEALVQAGIAPDHAFRMVTRP